MNLNDLIKLLKGEKVYIQTHNFPDPDAIASAFGLKQFLKYHGIESTICYDGKIEKLNIKKMVTTFGIDIYPIKQLEQIRGEEYVITVDAQKLNANITGIHGNEIACIDHHPMFVECDYKYQDIRMTGACATIIASYYDTMNTPIEPNVAAALLYGIKMDTLEFTRGVTELDVNMFGFLFRYADKDKLNSMYRNVMEFEDLRAYGAAIETISVCDRIGFAEIPFDCPDGLIATISEFILSLNVVEVAIVYARREDGLKISVRSEVEEINAGTLTNLALSSVGNGGGHPSMAGGFIPNSNRSKLGDNVNDQLKQLFLRQMEFIKKGRK